MAENEYGVHTVTSHGSTLIKEHVLDYVTLSLLVGIELFLLYFVKPFSGFVGREMMMDLMYPMKDEIVPDWFVPTCSVLLPIAMFVIFYTRRKDVYDLHHSTLGLLFAVLINAIITDAMKNATGYPRPDFFWRCFPNGDATYNASTGIAMCHGNPNSIREGYKSFPSGRTSWSFAGLGFLSHYLAGKIKAFDGRGHIAKLCIVALPLSIASLVGLSQVDDYRHHWQDVSAGGLIGWAPHASHRAREASQEAPQEASQEAPQEASQEVPQEAPQEASQEAPQEAPQEASQEVPQEAPQEASQEAPQEASQEAPQEALQEASEEASQESAGDE